MRAGASSPPQQRRSPTAVPPDASSVVLEEVWHYRTPRHGVQGPFSLRQLVSFREHLQRLRRWATLRIWKAGQPEGGAVLLAELLQEEP